MMQRHPSGRARTDLLGRAVLLVEDDFCEARDTQQALQHAGASVIGPFGDSESALRSIAGGNPSCAILDIHLRDGTRFNVAEALLDKGVPIIFVTGADSSMIPQDLSEVPVLQKPVDFHSLLRLTASLSDKRLA
jgi:DNA-binding response OmpR family regulator